METSGIITLTTDFGVQDPYVGAMKGVILSINPQATMIDITHGIQPGSIYSASLILKEAHSYFPKGTIHLGVVDPGVGSDRRPVLIRTEKFFFVGPDNGIFWPSIMECEVFDAIHLTKRQYFMKNISSTFHGRDIFAPVAAHLSMGIDPMKMGNPISDPLKLEMPSPLVDESMLSGHIMRVDRFGNLITNIHKDLLKDFLNESSPVVTVGGLKISGLSKTYHEAGEGEIIVLSGSSGFIEISENKGRACDRIAREKGTIRGMRVEVKRSGKR
ncbi:S-adenosyl-l-methionine hydroxide adenosyltransferase family protein [Thermodesulfobacteriota bacterium]